jgi:hypothetical protein
VYEMKIIVQRKAMSLFDLFSVSCKFTFTFLDGFYVLCICNCTFLFYGNHFDSIL